MNKEAKQTDNLEEYDAKCKVMLEEVGKNFEQLSEYMKPISSIQDRIGSFTTSLNDIGKNIAEFQGRYKTILKAVSY